LELAELVKRGTNPALVIAAPVGFVKAKESKEEILKLPVPCIAVRGEKGGTPVAVAIVNALIKLAEKNEQET
jgi:precorrin-8X/cobalt-precorrin-8 methylmutase